MKTIDNSEYENITTEEDNFIFTEDDSTVDLKHAREKLKIYVIWSADHGKLIEIQKRRNFRDCRVSIFNAPQYENLEKFKEAFLDEVKKEFHDPDVRVEPVGYDRGKILYEKKS